MNKIKIYWSLLLAFLIVSSCTQDVLEVYSTTKVSAETFWKTESDANLALNGVYNRLGSYVQNYLYLDVVADNAYNNYPWEGFKAIADGTHDVWGPGAINWLWDDAYRGIGRANTFLDNIDNVNMPEAKKTVMKGEAIFLRAYFYQQLSDLYGGVPIVLETPILEHGALPRDSKSDVVAQIVKDLDAAAGMLPETASYPGQATVGAAIALKARVLLYDEQWGDAASAASQVINMNYSLYPNYRDMFKLEHENNEEVIFDAQYISPEQGNFFDLYLGAGGGTGWQSIVPLQELVDDFEMTDGKAIDESDLYDAENPYENRDPRLKQSIFVTGSDYNGIGPLAFQSGTPPKSYTGFCFKKYTPYDEGVYVEKIGYPTGTGNNIILMRYADVLLMYAEAKNEVSGPDASVYDAINQVRSRESIQMPDIPAGLSKDEMREVIHHERRVEFALEGTRYSDIRRWGIAEDLLDGLVDFGGTRKFNAGRDYLWPIPGKLFDLPDNALEQNPGYGN
ncbi:MAG: RagB/SusD family nutrient uptake outer membrane protein [Bacteroidota bacterium]